MSKKLFLLLLQVIMVISFIAIPVAKADSFVISGTLQTADATQNKYNANYTVTTPAGTVYYLKLDKEFYKDWVGKTVYFNAQGSYTNFALYSSGLGARTNTLPKTGPEVYSMIFSSLIASAGFMTWKKYYQTKIA